MDSRSETTLSRSACHDSRHSDRQKGRCSSPQAVEVTRKKTTVKGRWQQTGFAMQGILLHWMLGTNTTQCQEHVWWGYCSWPRTEQQLKTYTTVCRLYNIVIMFHVRICLSITCVHLYHTTAHTHHNLPLSSSEQWLNSTSVFQFYYLFQNFENKNEYLQRNLIL